MSQTSVLQDSMLQALLKGTESLGLKLNQNQLEQLIDLQNKLVKWNKVFNLTAITDEKLILQLHLLDSLSLVPFWNFEKTLDVGTGAGFPGLPLAIALPDKTFHLLDSNSKKTRFIQQQIHHLNISNVVIHHARIEQHKINNYDAIVSRAFASITDMLNASEKLLAKNGRWMAMKGVYPEKELAELPAWAKQENIHNIDLPGLDAQRCVVELSKIG